MFRLCSKFTSGLWRFVKRRLLTFIAGFAAAVIVFILLNIGNKKTSTSAYCGSTCHEMNTSYQSWKLSPHGTNVNGVRVECVDCHLPPSQEYFTHLAHKAYYGAKDLYRHKFGPEYDLETIRQKVIDNIKNDACLHCHNDLLAKPSTAGARLAHTISIDRPDIPTAKCIACHEHTGHHREKATPDPKPSQPEQITINR